ncbi:transcriptional regulator [Nocardia terpenica]|uniref:Transcriptional regulator n=2 Tax=Nocardia terpenica TaxID=455432 RepID=A0A291RR20_9NOCA|nr:transcriptional regulator [Nocardia terpenica]
MDDMARRRELAAFLRSRRERIKPVDVGLAPLGRRRTPGLRREEIAQLSGVSVTWYTWLEQARDIRISRQVADTLARNLRMSAEERRHLFALAQQPLPQDGRGYAVGEVLYRLLDELDPNPAYVLGPRWDLLAWNRAEAGLIGAPDALSDSERNTIWLVFTDPAMRRLVVDWQHEARQMLAQYRAAAGQHAGDPEFMTLTEALRAASPEFREWWDEHDIAEFRSARKQFEHPALGLLTLDYTKLSAMEDSQLRVVVYLPADAETAAKLPLLADGNRAGRAR